MTEIEMLVSTIKKETKYFTDYSTLDQIITKYFELEESYELLAYEEVGSSQYSSYWKIQVEEVVNDVDMEDVEAVKNKKPQYFGTRSILNYLCGLGVIPKGEYMINVSW